MNRDPRVFLADILERARRIGQYIASGRSKFDANSETQDAVLHNFALIGEATRKIPAEFRAQHPEIPWERLNAFRNVIIHQYNAVNLDRVWEAATAQLPAVSAAIEALLPPPDQLEREVSGED